MSSYKILTMSGTDPELSPYLGTLYVDFIHTLRSGCDWFKAIDEDRYYKKYKAEIPKFLARPEIVIRLACLTDDLDVCLGWSVSEGSKLHYVYVRKDQRRQGIGTSVLPKEFNTITHLTHSGWFFRKKVFPNIIFDPFI